MRYQGGKYAAARHIAERVLMSDRPAYLEPFVGGASVLAKVAPHVREVVAGDANPSVVLMWRAVARGWVPPTLIDEEDYELQRRASHSAIRGFVGHACSYGGAWFNGYMPVTGPRPRVPGGENPAATGSRSCVRKAAKFAHAKFAAADYRAWSPGPEFAVYCDPPYEGTRGYGRDFDHAEFWSVAEEWSEEGAAVFVSEYSAPAGWVPAWSGRTPRKIESNRGKYQVEVLWMREGE